MRNMTGSKLEAVAAEWAEMRTKLDELETQLQAAAKAAGDTLDFPDVGVRVAYRGEAVRPDYRAWVLENVGWQAARSMGHTKVVVDWRAVMETVTGRKSLADFVDVADLEVGKPQPESATVKLT